jgi:Ala-tRNA(Pro) deacylase
MTERIRCRERLADVLRAEGVAFELLRHRQAYTTSQVAAVLHVSGNQVAKTVIVEIDDEMAMAVLAALQRVRLPQLQAALRAKSVKLARASDFQMLFPDCAIGAMPIFGVFYLMPVYLDAAFALHETVIFRAGSYRHAMRMSMADYKRVAAPILVDLTGDEYQTLRSAA